MYKEIILNNPIIIMYKSQWKIKSVKKFSEEHNNTKYIIKFKKKLVINTTDTAHL